MPSRHKVRDRRRRRQLWQSNAAGAGPRLNLKRKKRRLNLEALEPRLLLTTLFGGETFTYVAADPENPNEPGQNVAITLEGNIIAEFIAADIDDNNTPILGNLPGTISGGFLGRGGTRILGGTGGADGVTPIGSTPIDDPINLTNIGLNRPDDINFSNLATRSGFGATQTYGFNVGSQTTAGGDQTIVQLGRFDHFGDNPSNDVILETTLHQATMSADNDTLSNLNDGFGTPVALNDIGAMAVDPTTGLLYVINNEGGPDLWEVNRLTGVATELATITYNEGGAGVPLNSIQAMAIDDAGDLYVLTQDYDGNINTDSSDIPVGPQEDIGGVPTDPKSTSDVAYIDLGPVAGNTGLFVDNDVHSIRVAFEGGFFETTNLFTGAAFDDNGDLYGALQLTDDQGQPIATELHRIDDPAAVAPGAVVNTLNLGEIDAGGTTNIQGIAFTTIYDINDPNAADVDQLVGIDHAEIVNGVTQPKMVSINTDDPGQSALLSLPGTADQVFGLASYLEPGDNRPLLYSSDGDAVIRGSAVTLPLSEDGAIEIESIKASAFNPVNGLLYFVVPSGDNEADRMFTIDVSEVGRSNMQNSLELIDGAFGESPNTDRDITSIAFDQAGPNLHLWAFDAASSSLFRTSPTDTDAINTDIDVEFRGDAITDISAIEFPFENPGATEQYIVAVENIGTDSRLLRVTLANDGDQTNIYELGPLPDPDDTVGPIRGEDIQGLSFNPTELNPFTGEVGVLIGTDVTTDELVYIDHRPRFPNADLFQINVVQADATAGIRVSVYDPGDGTLEPFQGNVVQPLQFAVLHGTTRQQIIITQDENTGGALLGTRTEDIDPNLPPPFREDLIPVTFASLTDAVGVQLETGVIGTRPEGVGDGDTVVAGFSSAESLLEFVATGATLGDRVMGGNLDDITQIAVSRDGLILVIDEDNLSYGNLLNPLVGPAQELEGAEIAIIDPITGEVSSLFQSIRDELTGLTLGNAQGFDFGDRDLDGEEDYVDIVSTSGEDLYAIFDVDDPVPSDPIGDLSDLNAILPFDVLALTSEQNGQLWGVLDNGVALQLFRVDRDLNTEQVNAVTVIGDIRVFDNTPVSNITGLEIDPITNNLMAIGDPGTGNSSLLRIFRTASDIDNDTNPNEVLAVSVAELTLGGNPITDEVNALAYNPGGGNLFVALRRTDLNPAVTFDDADFLYTVNEVTGELTPSVADPITPTQVIESRLSGGGLGGNLAPTAVSVDNDNPNDIYVVSENGAGGFDLVLAERGGLGAPFGELRAVTNLGTIQVGGQDVVDIEAMEYDPNFPNTMYVVGATAANPDLTIFRVSTVDGTATDLGELGRPADQDINSAFATIVGLAFDDVTDELYGVLRRGGEDVLYTIATDGTGDIAFAVNNNMAASTIQVGNTGAMISGMDFDGEGRLIAFDDSVILDPANPLILSRQVIEIDIADPVNSQVVLAATMNFDQNIVGLSSNDAGDFYGIQDNRFDIAGGDDLLLISGGHQIVVSNGLAAYAPTLNVGGDLGTNFNVGTTIVDSALNTDLHQHYMIVDTGGIGTIFEISRGGANFEVDGVFGPRLMTSGAGALTNVGGVDFDSANDVMFTIGAPVGSTTFGLYTVDPATGASTLVGELDRDNLGAFFDTDDFSVSSIAYNEQGDGLLYVAMRNDLTGDEQLLTMTPVANAGGTVTVEIIGDITIGSISTEIEGMDFNGDGDLIALDDSNPLGRRAVAINIAEPESSRPLTNPNISVLPPDIHGYTADLNGNFYSIENGVPNAMNDTLVVNARNTAVTSMDFNLGGGLFAVSDPIGTGNAKVVTINTADPGSSIEQGGAGSIVDGFAGYGSDAAGTFYSIDTSVNPNEVLQSVGFRPTLGVVDPDGALFDPNDPATFRQEATFTIISPIDIADGFGDILSMAFSPNEGHVNGQQGLFVLTSNGNDQFLVEIDPLTGAVVTDGVGAERISLIDTLLINQFTGLPDEISISSIDFNTSTGQLLGIDAHHGRLIDIDLVMNPNPLLYATNADVPAADLGTLFAGNNVVTSDGSIRASVPSFAYDASQDIYIAADNSTGSQFLGIPGESLPLAADPAITESSTLFRLLGTESDSAEGQIVNDFMFAGTIIGAVNHPGSFNRFYAGWLLTGNTLGEDFPNQLDPFGPSVIDNFFVAGDLRDLVVADSIGTDEGGTVYSSGFDLHVGGKLGQVWSLQDVMGEFESDNAIAISNLDSRTLIQSEFEQRRLNPVDRDAESLFNSGVLFRRDEVFYNDSFDTAQTLGTIRNGVDGRPDVIDVVGVIEHTPVPLDEVDYYSVGLLAGQTVTIQLTSLIEGSLNVGLFDPEGRLVATDYDNNNGLAVGLPFQYTTDRPGEYRLAVTTFANSSFLADGALDILPGSYGYELTVQGAGDIAIGGIRADQAVLNRGITLGGAVVLAHAGDFGALRIPTGVFNSSAPADFVTELGAVRALDANDYGVGVFVNAFSHIGFIQQRGPAVANLASLVTGGDLQSVNIPTGSVFIDLTANGGLGVLRSSDMSVPGSSILLNADQAGNDGIIDLIDITSGDLNGPAIDTGPGGNVRYIRVVGDVFQHPSFSGDQAFNILDVGEDSGVFVDDSGAEFVFEPVSMDPDNQEILDQDPATALRLGYRSFGILSGGSVLIDVVSTGSVRFDDSFANNTSGSLEVSNVIVGFADDLTVGGQGNFVYDYLSTQLTPGRFVIDDPVQGLIFDPTFNPDVTLDVGIAGDVPVDILSVAGFGITNIVNETGGEIVSVIGRGSIGNIVSTGTVGLADTNLDVEVSPGAVQFFANTTEFPFNQQFRGVASDTHIISVQAGAGLGNIIAQDGSIQTIVANAGDTDDPTRFEGINGPIVAGTITNGIFTPFDPNGDIRHINIGEGILPSGTGNLARAGIFAAGHINSIGNSVPAVIRGDIIAGQGIDKIHLIDGSIINAEIFAAVDLISTLESDGTVITFDSEFDPITDPISEIGEIRIKGNGGIIGSLIAGSDIGDINVQGGFGIFNSVIFADDNGQISSVQTDGLGLRTVVISGGNAGSIIASGQGDLLDLADFTSAVRQSELREFDPFSGLLLTGNLDLHQYLGTTAQNTVVPDVTNSGILEAVQASGSRNLTNVIGYRTQANAQEIPTVISYANQISRFSTIDTMTDTSIITGKIGQFRPGSDVIASTLRVAGDIGFANIKGNLIADSVIEAQGPSGSISRITVQGDVDGRISAAGTIGSITIGGDLDGLILVNGVDAIGDALRSLKLGGSFIDGGLDVNGSVGTIDIADDLGGINGLEDRVVVNGNLRSLRVGTDRLSSGSDLAADVVVLGDLQNLDVTGKISGNLFVTGKAGRITINGDDATGINAPAIPTFSTGDLLQGLTSDFDASALAVTADLQLFAVENSGVTTELYGFNRNADGTLNELSGQTYLQIGEIFDPVNNTSIFDIESIDTNPTTGMLTALGHSAYAIAPSLSVGGDLGAPDLDIAGLAVDIATNTVYMAVNTGVNFELQQINRNAAGAITGVTTLGTIQDGAVNVEDIAALEYDHVNNRLLAVGTTAAGELNVYTITPGTGNASSIGELLGNDPLFNPAPTVPGVFTFNSADFDVTGITFSDGGSTGFNQGFDDVLYAVLRNTNTGDEKIVTIATDGSGLVDDSRADILVDGLPTTIEALELRDGKFIAYDDSAGGRRMISINFDAPESSVAVSDNTLSASTEGLTLDANGDLLSVLDNGGNDELLAPTNEQSIYTIDTTPMNLDGDADFEVTATFAAMPFDPPGINILTDDVAASAITPDGSSMLIVRDVNGVQELHSIDLFTFEISAVGAASNIVADGSASTIIGMDFDPDGNLIAIDETPFFLEDGTPIAARMIQIDLADPSMSIELTTEGTVSENLRGFTIDPNNFSYSINDGDGPNNQLWRSDPNVLDGRINIGGALQSLTVNNGNFGGLGLVAGGDVGTVTINNGSLAAGAFVTSALGDIRSFTINNGDIAGSIRAPRGDIGTISGRGGVDFGFVSLVEAMNVRSITIDGGMIDNSFSGPNIMVDNQLGSIRLGGDVEALASISAGESRTINVGGDFNGTLDIGTTGRSTSVTIGNDFGGQASFGSDTRFTVNSDFLSGAMLSVNADLTSLTVNGRNGGMGILTGSVFVDGSIKNIRVESIEDAVITAGFNIDRITADEIEESLIQAGLSRGADGIFNSGDFGDAARMGHLKSVTATDVTDSIFAAGGDIGRLNIRGLTTDSTFSAGYSVGGASVLAVMNDTLNLVNDAHRDTIRGDAGRELLRGSVSSAMFGIIDGSAITAGIDPGATGIFGDVNDTILTSRTGGMSEIKMLRATGGAGSIAVADADIRDLSGGLITTTEDFEDTDLITHLTTTNALSTMIAGGNTITYNTFNGESITLRLTGPGTLEIYDEAGVDSDNLLDAVVLLDTTRSSRLTITTTDANGGRIGRILSGDNSQLSGIMANDIDIVGDGVIGSVDVWIDGPVSTLGLNGIGTDTFNATVDSGFQAVFGGDIRTFNADVLGSGQIRVGGKVTTADFDGSTGEALFSNLSVAGPAYSTELQEIASDTGGMTFVFDDVTGLSQIDLSTGLPIAGPVVLTDVMTGNQVLLGGLDFNADTPNAGANPNFIGAVEALSYIPEVQIGGFGAGAVTLSGLAIDSTSDLDGDGVNDNRAFAILSSTATDRLVEIDIDNGSISLVGEVRSAFGNVYSNDIEQLAFDQNGNLLAILSDRDGTGISFDENSGAVLVEIETADLNNDGIVVVSSPINPAQPFVPLDFVGDFRTGGVDYDANGLAVSSNNTIYGSFHNTITGQDEIYIIGRDGEMVALGPANGVVQVGGNDTNLVGIGFDEDGNLVGYNNDAGSAELILIGGPRERFLHSENDAIDNTFNDAINIATQTGMALSGNVFVTTGRIGDNQTIFDDFDVFELESVTLGELITVNVDAVSGSVLDPIVGVYNSAGQLVLSDDNGGVGTNAALSVVAPANDDYFVVIAGASPGNLPNPYAIASSGTRSLGDYEATFSVDGPDPSQSTIATIEGGLNANIDAFAIGNTTNTSESFAYDFDGILGGMFYSNPAPVEPLPSDVLPQNIVGSLLAGNGLGADLDSLDIAVSNQVDPLSGFERAFILNNNAGVLELLEMNRGGDNGEISSVTTVGDIETPIGTAIQNLFSITTNQAGQLLGVGTIGVQDARQLFAINPDTAVVTFTQMTENGVDFEDDIKAIAFQPIVQNVYGIHELDNGTQRLVRLDTNSGQVINIGNVEVGGVTPDIQSIAFDRDGRLIAIDDSDGGRRTIVIDLANPDDSTELNLRGDVNENLQGLGSTPDGTLFSIYDDNTLDNQLWASPRIDRAVVLGVVDSATGDYTQLRPLASDANGTPLTSSAASIAIDNNALGTGNIFVVTEDGRLFEYDTNGQFVNAFGPIRDAGTNIPLNVSAIDFNDTTGALIGTDDRFDRLVQINTADGTAVALTNSGSAGLSNLSDIDYDISMDRIVGIDNANDAFIQLTGTSEATIGGFQASDIGRITLGETGGNTFGGRIIVNGSGNTFITINGDFDGSFVTSGGVQMAMINNGEFSGLIKAADDIGFIMTRNTDVAAGGTFETSGQLRTLMTQRGRDFDGNFDGRIIADSASMFMFNGVARDSAEINVTNDLRTFMVNGTFEGSAQIGDVSMLMINGTVGPTANINITGDAGFLRLRDVLAGSTIRVGGDTNFVMVSGQMNSLIAVDGSARTVMVNEMNQGIVAVGTDAGMVMARGDITDSLISIGVDIGADGIYNTEDDRIIGGSSRMVMVTGEMRDSIIAAGVLPNMDRATNPSTRGLPLDNYAYLGRNITNFNSVTTFVDDAEAGGVLPSNIGMVMVNGNVINSNATGEFGRVSGVAAAGDIGRVLGRGADELFVREYEDEFGAPQALGLAIVSNSEFQVFFNEEINSSSLILSQDLNDNGNLTDVGDILGTVTITDQLDNIIDDGIQLAYTTIVNPETQDVQGVLRVVSQGGFDQLNLTIKISGGVNDDPILFGNLEQLPAVFDRSGGRSLLRDFNVDGTPGGLEVAFGGNTPTVIGEDPFGTIFDGDENNLEGGNANLGQFFTDAPDSFEAALAEAPLDLAIVNQPGSATFTVNNTFATVGDIDIYRIQANAFQFLSVEFVGDVSAQMGLFVHDVNNLADPFDDSFEIMARWEDTFSLDEPILFQALELPPMESTNQPTGFDTEDLNYFIVVSHGGINDPDGTNDYSLEITLASTDDLLDGDRDNQLELPADEQVGYISNAINDANNRLGANTPKQLVYLNFDGGLAEDSAIGNIMFDEFSAAGFDATLVGFEDILINGGQIGFTTITGIVENVMSIYQNTPASHPAGQLNVQRLGSDLAPFINAVEGLFFTTIDPALSGLDPDTDYSTIYIGETNQGGPGLLGVAQQIDFANLDKADEVIVISNNFAGASTNPNLNARLNDYSVAFANTVAHEFGHILGFNHTGNLPPIFNQLFPIIPLGRGSDDPDNDPNTPDDSNTGQHVIGSGPTADPVLTLTVLEEFGTANLETSEFPIGDEDTVDLLLRWLK